MMGLRYILLRTDGGDARKPSLSPSERGALTSQLLNLDEVFNK
ncbi:MAG: hypothetical protein WDO73_20800 [Ignavibacteriota bacterium]